MNTNGFEDCFDFTFNMASIGSPWGAVMIEILEKELVFRIVGCALTVHNALGSGFREKTYENALVVEFRRQGIGCDQQARFAVPYFGEKVDEFVPDLLVEKRVIVDTKVTERIVDSDRGRLLNYLRVTSVPVGLIINFKHPRLEWERFVSGEYGTRADK
jgi:GxxExxY protein